jgi:predicted XRE-type DNA-binding protein
MVATQGTIPIVPSSGNVFRALELPEPDMALTKAELVRQIRTVITERKLTQARAAQLLGLDQPKVSALVRGRVAGYSLERLFKFLNRLGRHVEITIRPARVGAQAADTRVVVG